MTITVFITTGRILIQGKKFEEWSAHEFPVLLNMVNDLSNIQSFSSVQDQSFFASSLHNFLVNLIHFIDDEYIPPLNKPGDLKIECNGTKTVSSSAAVEPLSLTPTRLKSISTMRDTLGQLEADFTQFQITSSGDLQNMKDKLVQQDNLLKLQKQSIHTLSNDLSLHISNLSNLSNRPLSRNYRRKTHLFKRNTLKYLS